MLCSVIVPTYNRSSLLAYTLASLRDQSMAEQDYEVIVVDDGSSDDTRAVVDRFKDSLNLSYFYQDDCGYRVAKARNVGIREAKGDVCIFIDSGVIASRDLVRSHWQAHQKHPNLAINGYVYCFNEDNEDAKKILELIDPLKPDVSMDALSVEEQFLDLRESFYHRYGEQLHQLKAPWLIYWTCNVSARREQLIKVGMFDEAYQSWGAEDVDLAYRLFQDGAQFQFLRNARAIHYPHEKSYSTNMAAAAENYQYFARKYDNPISWLVPDHHFDEINDLITEQGLDYA